MTLASGLKLGPYEIVALLGAGGMGEVYRARDTRLERTVAIKICPPTSPEILRPKNVSTAKRAPSLL
jgi:serine/threonine protein kinase